MTVPSDTSFTLAGSFVKTSRRRLARFAVPVAAAVAALLPFQAGALWSLEVTPPAADSTPFGIAVVNNVPWFTEQNANKVATLNPTTGAVQEFPASPLNSAPQALVYDSVRNALWYPERSPMANNIAQFSLSAHTVTEFPMATGSAGAVGITLDGQGNVWFTETAVGKIGEVTCSAPTTCTATDYSANVGSAAAPLFITYRASDTTLWWTDRDTNAIGWATLGSGAPTIHNAISVTANSQPYGITVGPDNNIWYTQHLGNAVAVVDAACVGGTCPTPYVVATPASAPAGIITGPDGNLWFAEQRGNKIAKMHVSGAMAGEFVVNRTNAGPNLLASGTDRVWFSESGLCIANCTPPATPTVVLGQSVVSATQGMSGYYNDGYGGLHPWWSANSPQPPQMTYSPGDGVYSSQIIKALAVRGDGASGYTMDAYGGVHGFGPSASKLPPYLQTTWSGFPTAPLARGIALCPDGSGGYMVDAYGGLHPFTSSSAALPPMPQNDLTGYWPGRDYARGIVLTTCRTVATTGANPQPIEAAGYVLDLYGGLSPFGSAGPPPPPPTAPVPGNFPPRIINIAQVFGDYWPGRDLARAVVLRPYAVTATAGNPNGNGVSGYTLDAWGGIHPVGSTQANVPPQLATNGAAYSSDVISGVALAADGSNAWSVDVYGGVHVLGPVNGLNNPRTRDYYPGNRIITSIAGVG